MSLIHLLRRSDVTIGAVSLGATGKSFHRVSKAATARAVTSPRLAPMRSALEGAAVRVAPSMSAQEVANSVWAAATLGWQAREEAMRCALEGAAVRVAPTTT